MLRFLIGTGVLLMLGGFGAAGWQYWQTLPKNDAAATAEVAPDAAVLVAEGRQTWLISPTGGLVPQEVVQTYLAQERFVPGRTVTITRQANLADLLAEGEKLPEPVYLQVLADIRAPRVAEGLCPLLLDTIAAECAVHAARAVEDSADPVGGTAMFRIELVYQLKQDGVELPDLAAHVLRTELVQLEAEAGTEAASRADAALKALITAATEACAAEGAGLACRPMQFWVDWTPGQPVALRAEVGWLDPLPKGMFVAPPLDPAAGG